MDTFHADLIKLRLLQLLQFIFQFANVGIQFSLVSIAPGLLDQLVASCYMFFQFLLNSLELGFGQFFTFFGGQGLAGTFIIAAPLIGLSGVSLEKLGRWNLRLLRLGNIRRQPINLALPLFCRCFCRLLPLLFNFLLNRGRIVHFPNTGFCGILHANAQPGQCFVPNRITFFQKGGWSGSFVSGRQSNFVPKSHQGINIGRNSVFLASSTASFLVISAKPNNIIALYNTKNAQYFGHIHGHLFDQQHLRCIFRRHVLVAFLDQIHQPLNNHVSFEVVQQGGVYGSLGLIQGVKHGPVGGVPPLGHVAHHVSRRFHLASH
mmetsp:Transcript_12013/g.26582  ORF Transcript_12013/g.26582 Transcript_12013/m.26582 type:complete len:319 (+) Transcript_12013:50-1006(+)